MRKLKPILVTVLVVLVLIAGGIWGYLWYSTRQQAKQIVAMAQPFAEISYESIEVLPTGSTGVKQIKIAPYNLNDVFTIGAVRLNAPNILALLNTRRQLSQGQLPEAMSFSVHEFELPLYGGAVDAKPPAPGERTPFNGMEALGCGPVIHFGGAELEEMGYDSVISNMEVGYRLDTTHNHINLQVSGNTRDWATFYLDIGFALNIPPTLIVELAGSLTPKLANLRLVFQDDGYNARRNNYCAAQAGKPVNEYLADHARLVAERLRANGITLGPGLIAAYQRYLTEGGQLVITANPPIPIDPAELQFYAAEDAIKLAGLTVSVNEQEVADLSMEWDTAQIAKALGAQPPANAGLDQAIAPKTVKPVIIQREFHAVEVNELNRHVGRIAKLQTQTGANYQGKLETTSEGGVRITIRRSGGTATLSLRNEDITKAQVFY